MTNKNKYPIMIPVAHQSDMVDVLSIIKKINLELMGDNPVKGGPRYTIEVKSISFSPDEAVYEGWSFAEIYVMVDTKIEFNTFKKMIETEYKSMNGDYLVMTEHMTHWNRNIRKSK